MASKLYFVAEYGHSYPNPAGVPLPQARKEAAQSARDSARRARAKFGGGYVHRLSPDCWRVTLAQDPNSTLWAHFSILPV